MMSSSKDWTAEYFKQILANSQGTQCALMSIQKRNDKVMQSLQRFVAEIEYCGASLPASLVLVLVKELGLHEPHRGDNICHAQQTARNPMPDKAKETPCFQDGRKFSYFENQSLPGQNGYGFPCEDCISCEFNLNNLI